MWTTKLQSPQSKNLALHAAGMAVVLAVAGVFYQGFYAAWGLDLKERSQQIDRLVRLSTTAEPVAREHRQLLERRNTLTAAITGVSQRMPPLAPATEFINQVTQLARTFELEVVQCTAGAPQTTATHATVEVTCKFNGSFANTCKYLAAIDQLPQIAKVSSLEMKTAGNSDAYPVQATFQLYYQPKRHDTKEERAAL